MNQKNLTRQRIHVIFKSHLDVGFTDLSSNVVDQYMEQYIPQALRLIDSLEDSDLTFIWTTGSWLIDRFLRTSSPSLRRKMEYALGNKTIRWHAIPFTVHSELASPELFRAGLRISKDLDHRFGIHTIAAKFTDIPGHTQGIIPLLEEYGIKYLHIGTNPACIPADLPPLFRWRSADGSQVVVNYQSGYGNVTECPIAHTTLWFSHLKDNEQPPDRDSLTMLYAHIRKQYPQAVVEASDLDSFARDILQFSDHFPIIDQEVGDTWIHGVGTDPLKVARYRALCRVFKQVDNESENIEQAKRSLLLVAEHTWGMDLKRYLPDYLNYKKDDFTRARKQDIISMRTQEKGRQEYTHPDSSLVPGTSPPHECSYSVFESSWQEQRLYINQSIAYVKDPKVIQAVNESLLQVTPFWPSLEKYTPISLLEEAVCGPWHIEFNQRTGAISSLYHEKQDIQFCRHGGNIGQYQYNIYSDAEYQQFYRTYLVAHEDHYRWSLSDYTKPGLERVKGLERKTYYPEHPKGYIMRNGDHTEIRVISTMPNESVDLYGAPKHILMCYRFTDTCRITLHWKNKDANRIPESSWIEFGLDFPEKSSCLLDKMGMKINPLNVVKYGNRALHAIDRYLYCSLRDNSGNDREILLESRDAPLVSIGRPRVLAFDQSQPDCSEGVFFNLHNNLWGTNFPMWYSDDGLFEFTINIGKRMG